MLSLGVRRGRTSRTFTRSWPPSGRAGGADRFLGICTRAAGDLAPHRSESSGFMVATCFIATPAAMAGIIVHLRRGRGLIGILGTPFNREQREGNGYGDKIPSARTRWCASPTPRTTIRTTATSGDSSTFFKGDQQITTMYPERRFYRGQPAAANPAENSLPPSRRPVT